jgi:hypothetical protein
MRGELHDWEGYDKRRGEVDAAILAELADGGKTYTELSMKLRSLGIGNATSDEPLNLAYSTTGAILRTAVIALRNAGKIYDSWDVATGRDYEKPFRFFRHSEAA